MTSLAFPLTESTMRLRDCLPVAASDESAIVTRVCVAVGLGIILGFKM